MRSLTLLGNVEEEEELDADVNVEEPEYEGIDEIIEEFESSGEED